MAVKLKRGLIEPLFGLDNASANCSIDTVFDGLNGVNR